MSEPQTLAGGRYLLVERLGEGGMATVWRAFDQRLQVWRAIKVLLPEFSSRKKIIARFETEAQTMALLEHPNIVRVYDVDRDGEHAYIVMELVEGGSLVDWLERHGPMPARMALDVIVEVCQALQVAHGKGVIHRDIKPHNVMVDRDGTCRLTDFGIARAGDTDASLTKTGAVMGTWGFMAPEQRTDAKHVDERADVYALAATLYALLTDKTPLELFAADRDPSMLEGVPEPLFATLVRATEYRKEERFGSAQEFAAALLGVRDALPEDPSDAPSLRRDVAPMAPPPKPMDRPAGVASRGGAETMIPDEADASGAYTVPPQDHAPLMDPVGQQRPVWVPPQEEGPGRSVVAGSSGGRGPMLVGFVLALLLGGGAAAYVLLPGAAPSPAPSPVVTTAPSAPSPAPEAVAAVVTTEPVPPAPASAPARRPTPDHGSADDAPPQRPAPVREAPEVAPPPPVETPSVASLLDDPPPAAPASVEAPPVAPPSGTPEAPAEVVQCFERVEISPTVPTVGAPLGFRVYTCKKQEAVVTLFYRPVGASTWYSVDMPYRLGSNVTSLRIEDELAAGVEWYLESEGVTWGSASGPKSTSVRAD